MLALRFCITNHTEQSGAIQTSSGLSRRCASSNAERCDSCMKLHPVWNRSMLSCSSHHGESTVALEDGSLGTCPYHLEPCLCVADAELAPASPAPTRPRGKNLLPQPGLKYFLSASEKAECASLTTSTADSSFPGTSSSSASYALFVFVFSSRRTFRRRPSSWFRRLRRSSCPPSSS